VSRAAGFRQAKAQGWLGRSHLLTADSMVLDQASFLQAVLIKAYQISEVKLVFSVGLKASEWLRVRPTSLSATGKDWLKWRPEARSERTHLVVAALLLGVQEDQAVEAVLELVAVEYEVQL